MIAFLRPLPVVPICRTRVRLCRRANQVHILPRPASQEGRTRRHERRVRDAMDVASSGAMKRKTTGGAADGQVVWSWHPDADAPRNASYALSRTRRSFASRGNGGQKARRTRESTKQPLKPLRREGRDVLSRTCGDCRLHFFLQAGHGGGELPAFPVPSAYEEGDLISKARTRCAARMRVHVRRKVQ